jgi:hypothetical protein
MQIFLHQATACPPYKEYLEAIGFDLRDIERIAGSGQIEDIPFLPIELFKTHRVYCGGGSDGADGGSGFGGGSDSGFGFGGGSGAPKPEPEAVFTSSSTTGEGVARHYVARLSDYERIFTRGFELFYGDAARWSIYALLPSYLEREGSSLVYMVDSLMRRGRGGGFYLRDHARLMADMAADRGPKILLGVSYALLDLAEELTARGWRFPADTIVMETGGMKGRRAEMTKAAMHGVLANAFGVTEIHSEYGMAELMSQAYSAGGGVFRTPPWMRVLVRDPADPFDVRGAEDASIPERGIRGGVNIIDLGNRNSCAFIQTQDKGTLLPGGNFTIDGRIAGSDIRGCNLLVQ